ncbi:MAG: TA system VapC family ribonuclease toxin [Gaiella sp.]
MTLVDTNILLYATFTDAPEHARAREWLEREIADPDAAVALCWPVTYAFVRLASSRRVFGAAALSVAGAWEVSAALHAQPGVRIVVAGARHRAIAAELASTPGLGTDDVPDIELAALAIEHGLVLASHDAGFRRFAALRTTDPIA